MRPDERGIGGRLELGYQLKSHERRVLEAKASVSSYREQPKKARPSTGRARFGPSELEETYRRVGIMNARPPIAGFSAPPWEVQNNLAAALSYNRRVRLLQTDPTRHEHTVRVFNMQRRMEALDSRTERLKNPFDASVYPSLQRRVPPGAAASAATTRQLPPSGALSRGSAVWGRADLKPVAAGAPPTAARPRTAPPVGDRYSPAPAGGRPGAAEAEAVRSLRRVMLDEVIRRKLFKPEDLEELFARHAAVQGTGLSQAAIQAAIASLRADLDV